MYLALGSGLPRFRQDFSCPAVLRNIAESLLISYTGLSPSLAYLSRKVLLSVNFVTLFASPTTPPPYRRRFGLFPFRSPLLRELFLFLRLLRCFSSPRYLCYPMCSDNSTRALTPGGFPHSDILGYNVCTRLLEAYRSVPRPSSAFDTKAFTVCP